jgi:hypothetical protein
MSYYNQVNPLYTDLSQHDFSKYASFVGVNNFVNLDYSDEVKISNRKQCLTVR